MPDDSWQTYSTTLRKLLNQPNLLEEFLQDIDGTATADLGISPEMRNDLKKLTLLLPSQSAYDSVGPPLADDESQIEQGVLSAKEFFEATYAHLRRGAFLTTAMSVLVFLV